MAKECLHGKPVEHGCPQCRRESFIIPSRKPEVSAKVRAARECRAELQGAAEVAKKYGLHLAEEQLSRAAFEEALKIVDDLYKPG